MSIILGSNVWTKDLGDFELGKLLYSYHKVTSSNMFCLEAHAGLFGLLMKGIFMLFDLLAKKYF